MVVVVVFVVVVVAAAKIRNLTRTGAQSHSMTRRGKGGRERNGGASGRADGGGENSRCLVRKVGMWLSSGTGRYEGAMMRSGSTRRFDLSSVYYSI